MNKINLFNILPQDFFKPLTSKYKSNYKDCIIILYKTYKTELSFGVESTVQKEKFWILLYICFTLKKKEDTRCNDKYTEKGKIGCDNRHVDDDVFYKAIVEAYNAVVENKEHFMIKWEDQIGRDDTLIKVTAKRFIGIFKEATLICRFDMDLFFKLVEKIIVSEGGVLIVSLLDGTEIGLEIE